MAGRQLMAALAGAALLATGAYAADSIELTSDVLKAGMTYGAAREALIDSGWVPAGTCEGDAFMCNPAYPELESCAGTGAAPCRFRWAAPEGVEKPADAKFLAVITEGEMGRIITGLELNPAE